LSGHNVVTLDIIISDSELFRELGLAVAQTCRDLGYDSLLITAPEQLRRRPDGLLFIANFETLELFEPEFHRWESKPITGWWYLEQLPPGHLSDKALKIGHQLAGCFWPRLMTDRFPFTGRWLGQPRRGQKPKRNALTSLLQKTLSARLKHQLQKEGYDCSHLNYLDLFKMMCRMEQICPICKRWPIDYFITSIVSRCELLRQQGVNAHLVPIGYHPVYGESLSLPRDIDVAFLGHIRSAYDERGSIAYRVKKELESRGYKVELVTSGCFGRQRTEFMNRVKILVDVVKTPWELPGMRILIGASNGAMIVTTGFSGDASPYIEGRHFIEAPEFKLVQTLSYYLQNEPQRQTIAAEASAFIQSENTMKQRITQIMELYNAHSVIPSRCL
jgi:hypothetical protein